MTVPRPAARGRLGLLVVALLVCGLCMLSGTAKASAAGCETVRKVPCRAYWKLDSRAAPTKLPFEGEELKGANDEGLKGEGLIVVSASNLGDENTKGKVTVTEELPEKLEPVKREHNEQGCASLPVPCSVQGRAGQGVPGAPEGQYPLMTCAEPSLKEDAALKQQRWHIECTFEGELPPFEHVEVRVWVKSNVPKEHPEEPENVVTVSGGGLPTETLKQNLCAARASCPSAALEIVGATKEVSGKKVSATKFGVEHYEFTPENELGQPETQAGSHPFQLTSKFDLTQTYGINKELKSPGQIPEAPALQKDLNFRIPAGMLGNPNAVPQCPDLAFGDLLNNGINDCGDQTAIGVATVSFDETGLLGNVPGGVNVWSVPVFNLAPAPGEPAKFGFATNHVAVVLDTAVRTGEDYGVDVHVRNVSAAVQVLGAQVTLWGTPGDPVHDSARGWNCIESGRYVRARKPRPECGHNEFTNPKPFLLMPTTCGTTLVSPVSGDSWAGDPFEAANENPVTLECKETLKFDPSLTVLPDTSAGSTPSGMKVEVNMPQQETTMSPTSNGEADIKETILTLPEGVEANAGAANGLDVCEAEGAGFNGTHLNLVGQFEEATDFNGEGLYEEAFEPPLNGQLAAQHFTSAAAACPNGAKIGTVEVETPLLPHTLTGSLYLGEQNTNPFQPFLVLYLVATEEEPIKHEWSKVLIKLAGDVRIGSNGQLVSTFKNTPQAPFEHLRIHLFGGPRASQSTPAKCGPPSYTAKARMKSWTEGVEEKEPSSSFEVTSHCSSGTLPFNPAFKASPTNTQAGAYTHFELTIGGPDGSFDGNRALTGLTMRLPQGAAAKLASITPCPVAVADAGNCGPQSRIGHASTSSGVGSSPLTLEGEAFLTESLRAGTPFGVSVKTSAVNCTPEHPTSCAGPFNIGTIIANSTIAVDPNTAAATITLVETRIMESTGHLTIDTLPAALPTRIKNVPVQLKQVHVSVDQENFEFNPTRCTGTSITGAPIATFDTLTGEEEASVSQLTPYPVTGCDKIPFDPKLTAEVSGQGSKENGVTFTVKVENTFGHVNIAKTFLALPIALPSRLSTIQKACLQADFEKTFPPGQKCPEGSNIGNATAVTPVLKQPLKGPAYLVSHGSEAFPDVEFVLQGEGITVILDGKTDIKKGITYSRFETVPDAPVEKFETVLPAGPHSALTANVPESEKFNLCKHGSELVIPTEITGQNGTVIKQQTQVKLVGCGPEKGVSAFCRTKKGKTTMKCLQAALAECRKKYKGSSKAARKKRASCEANARKKFGPKHNTKHKKH
jgi:hypothetical protein